MGSSHQFFYDSYGCLGALEGIMRENSWLRVLYLLSLLIKDTWKPIPTSLEFWLRRSS